MVELHYSNPELVKSKYEIKNLNLDLKLILFMKLKKDVQDFQTIRLYATKKLRPIEIGMFTVGGVFDWSSILIPPGQEKYQSDYYFRKDCVNVNL